MIFNQSSEEDFTAKKQIKAIPIECLTEKKINRFVVGLKNNRMKRVIFYYSLLSD